MSIGLGVFLMALGAILSFAVRDALPGVDLVMVGYICMAAGLATVILSFVLMGMARRNGPRTVSAADRSTAPTRQYPRV